MDERIWHLAHEKDWLAAQAAGEYTWSTTSLTLEQEGFIHCSRPHQLPAVVRRYYLDDPETLVVLDVDPACLVASGTPIRVEPVRPHDPASERFPHLYGPLPTTCVRRVLPVQVDSDGTVCVDGTVLVDHLD